MANLPQGSEKGFCFDAETSIMFEMLKDGQPRSLKGLISRFGDDTKERLQKVDEEGERERRWRVLVDKTNGTVRVAWGQVLTPRVIREIAA
jgi:hypothetical protein